MSNVYVLIWYKNGHHHHHLIEKSVFLSMMYAHLALNNNHSLIRLLTSSDQYHSEREQTSVVTTSIKQYLILYDIFLSLHCIAGNIAHLALSTNHSLTHPLTRLLLDVNKRMREWLLFNAK
jgi:hypothetical protein